MFKKKCIALEIIFADLNQAVYLFFFYVENMMLIEIIFIPRLRKQSKSEM